MRRSRLYTLGGIGATAVIVAAAVVLGLGFLGLLLKIAAAAGVLPAKLANVANALPTPSATVSANPTAVSSISISA